MKKWIALLATVPLLFAMAVPALASTDYDYNLDGESLYLAPDTIWEDELFYLGEDLKISGTVIGDVYAVAGRVEVDGRIEGDLYVAAGDVTISGTVTEDVLAATELLVLDAAVIGDSVLTAASNVKADSDTQVGGAMMMATSLGNVDAEIGRGLWAAAASLKSSARVNKNMKVSADQFELQDGAVVAGNVEYFSVHELEMGEQVSVLGEVTWIERQVHEREFQSGMDAAKEGMDFGFLIWSYLSALVIGFLLIRFWPRVLEVSAEEVLNNPFGAAAYGALYLFGSIVAMIVLLFTVVGVPMAWLLSMDYVAALYLAKIVVAAFVGMQLAKWFKWKKANPYGLLALGLLLYYVLKSLPVLGGLVTFVGLLLAIGGMILMVIRLTKHMAKKW